MRLARPIATRLLALCLSAIALQGVAHAAVSAGAIGQANPLTKGMGGNVCESRRNDGGDSVPVGVVISGGAYVNGIRFICDKLANGKLSGNVYQSYNYGNTGGTHKRGPNAARRAMQYRACGHAAPCTSIASIRCGAPATRAPT